LLISKVVARYPIDDKDGPVVALRIIRRRVRSKMWAEAGAPGNSYIDQMTARRY
jgi:hypothetical protein